MFMMFRAHVFNTFKHKIERDLEHFIWNIKHESDVRRQMFSSYPKHFLCRVKKKKKNPKRMWEKRKVTWSLVNENRRFINLIHICTWEIQIQHPLESDSECWWRKQRKKKTHFHFECYEFNRNRMLSIEPHLWLTHCESI